MISVSFEHKKNPCHRPFTPATGVQIPLGTPNNFKGLALILLTRFFLVSLLGVLFNEYLSLTGLILKAGNILRIYGRSLMLRMKPVSRVPEPAEMAAWPRLWPWTPPAS